MRSATVTRRIRAMLLALPVLCLSAGEPAPAATAPAPVLAVDPLPGLAELETRSDAIRRWASQSLTRLVLVSFDTSGGLRPLGPGATAALAALGAAKTPSDAASPAGAGQRPVFEDGFVRAAVSLGIVREAYWIVSPDRTAGPDLPAAMRALLEGAGLGETDLRTFAMRDGCFRGTAAGIPFAVCTSAALPQVAEPVLVSVDADFLLAAAATGHTHPLAEVQRLLDALVSRRYRVVDTVLVASVASGWLSRTVPDLRWIGESLAQSLRDPTLIAGPMPKRWAGLRKLALLNATGNFPELLHEVLPFLTVHDEDPALHLYAAEALASIGRQEKALGHAARACTLHPGYCSGLPWIGLSLFAAGDVEGAEKFFAAGAALRPQMLFGQLARGLFLQQAGRSAEALAVFKALGDRGEIFPAAFLAGALHLGNGDRVSARREFDRGLQALRDEPPAQVVDPDIAAAIEAAARFLREEGLVVQAERLESDPLLKLPREEVPPAGTP